MFFAFDRRTEIPERCSASHSVEFVAKRQQQQQQQQQQQRRCGGVAHRCYGTEQAIVEQQCDDDVDVGAVETAVVVERARDCLLKRSSNFE